MNTKRSILEIPLFQKIYYLYKLLHLYYPNIPKSKRYTLWQKCDMQTLELLKILIATSHRVGEKRLISLTLMSQNLDLLKVLIRLSKDTQTINTEQYLAIEALLQEIGKMIGGWIKVAMS